MMMTEFEIKAITTNLNGPGTQYDKRTIISKVLRDMTPKPAIVFAQEIGAPTKTNPPWLVDGLAGYEICPSSFDAGIAWDTEIFERIRCIDAAVKLRALNSLKDKDSFDGGRTAIVVLEHKRSTKKVMCVSWHGKSAKAKAREKEAELYILLDFVNELLDRVGKGDESNKCDAVIIGGDFNIRKRSVPQCKPGMDEYLGRYSEGLKYDDVRQSQGYGEFVLVSSGNEGEEEKFKLDYLLWRGTEGFTFETDTQIVPLQQESKFLDHNPAVATFSFQGMRVHQQNLEQSGGDPIAVMSHQSRSFTPHLQHPMPILGQMSQQQVTPCRTTMTAVKVTPCSTTRKDVNATPCGTIQRQP